MIWLETVLAKVMDCLVGLIFGQDKPSSKPRSLARSKKFPPCLKTWFKIPNPAGQLDTIR